MRELSLRRVAGMAGFAATLVAAQPQGTTSSTTAPATTTTTTTPSTTNTGGSTTGTNSRSTSPSSTQSSQPIRPPQPVFVAGNVTLPDGTEPPDRVLIERVCSANRTRPEGYTDSKGRFSLQLGSQQLVADASEAYFGDPSRGNTTSSSSISSMDSLADCELRAKLPGYRSTTILLVGTGMTGVQNIGTLVVYPLTKDSGLSISATSANAPKDARKALEKGISEAKKLKFDQAEKEFKKATDLHPKYAEAWLEMGKLYAAKKRNDAARDALRRAIEADPKYVYPYEQLYKIAFDEGNWQDLADNTNKLLRLNPYEFPAAYYYNGVANLQLRNLDQAERSLEQALSADKRLANPKALYVMGLVLIQKHDYAGAMDALSNFAEVSPNDPTMPKVRSLLEELQKAR